MRNPRVLLAAGLAIVALVVLVVVLTAGGDGSRDAADEPPRVVRAKLTLEQARSTTSAMPELLVSLSVPELNRLDVTGGQRVVALRCVDAAGAQALRTAAEWPLVEEAGYLPHIHQPASPQLLASIRGCRLTGPGIEFEGRVDGRLPTAPTVE